MNNNQNANQAKLSFNFLKFLSLCALVTSTTTAAIEQLPSRQSFAPVNERQAVGQDSSDRSIESKEALVEELVEEIDLEKEWENLLGNESEPGFLAYSSRTL